MAAEPIIKQDTDESASDICKKRGHVIDRYRVEKNNDEIWVEDYPDSTCAYYYSNGVETGTIMRCKRCGKWLSPPKMDKPSYEVIWYKDKNKEKERLNKLKENRLKNGGKK